jgi:hypothetical protein
MKNFTTNFIEGSSNVRISAIKEHAQSDIHKRAMILYKKSASSVPTEYSSIARAFAQSSMDSSTRDKIKRKFETAYVIVKENLSFSKMKSICQLEERHGADLGKEYQNDKGCATFVEFIAKEQQEILQKSLESCNFFSIQS